MASLGSEPGGRRRILVVGRDGRRRTIRLGRMTLKAARTALAHVQALQAARISGSGVPDATAAWLGALPLPIHKRLVKAGLCEARPDAATVGEFLASYIASRGDVKPATLAVFGHTRRNLLAFFGGGRTEASITPTDAVAFVRWLSESEGLGKNTVRRRTGIARQFWRAAILKGLVLENPFADMPVTVSANTERQAFITREMFASVLDACPSAEWRLAFALCRYAGLRCPSEIVRLRWGDVNWERRRFVVTSPKTARYSGKGTRVVPVFAELEPYFAEGFAAAEPGALYCCPQFANPAQMYRKMLLGVLEKASVKPWAKLFVNLRATCATELFTLYPAHVAAAWMGHSPQMALRYYLQTPDEYFDLAAGVETASEKPAQNPAQYMTASTRKHPQAKTEEIPKGSICKGLRQGAISCEVGKKELVGSTGLEPVTSCL